MRVDITLTAAFPLGDVAAELAFADGGSEKIRLANGHFAGELARAPAHMKLLDETPEGGGPPVFAEPRGEIVSIADLFGPGVAVPADGKLVVQLAWGAPCVAGADVQTKEGKRFASFEHIRCAEYVGRERVGSANPPSIGGVVVPFSPDTGLPVGEKHLTFGEVICLAGDYYAHLDAASAEKFVRVWPPLEGVAAWLGGDYRGTTLHDDSADHVHPLLKIIRRDRDVGERGTAAEAIVGLNDRARHEYPLRRYLALASQNYCHFTCPHPGWTPEGSEALHLYDGYHARALEEAAQARGGRVERLHAALATDAFGCHFLTDSFSSGHMRVPRRLLAEQFGVLRGSLRMSKQMHDEDNAQGLWCTTLEPQGDKRWVWRAYGDGFLASDEAQLNLYMVQEAVRRSAAEVVHAFLGAAFPPGQSARGLMPVPLAPDAGPRMGDVMPDASEPPRTLPNHFPYFWFDDAGRVIERDGGLDSPLYKYPDGGAAQAAAF